ncbi:putative quinol monooxygenase [Nocardia sp. NPDC059240]|uniref:putative quinol monooxygenase n=1 Tax=Nocardia sp. NPDC059240 TaxID=3346786 RepID=UPI003699959A
MIAIIADLSIIEGRGVEFELLVAGLVEQVANNEPGNLMYRLLRSQTEPDQYSLVEIYTDAAALAAHLGSQHFQSGARKLAEFFAAAPKVRNFDAV